MSIDYRALCAQLADELERCRPLAEVPDCLQRARAALAAEADGPAVPEGREPASVVGEPSDVDLLVLMPQQFREDLATVSRMAAHGAGTGVTPGLFRVSLNTGALDYARAVLARYGHQPAPVAEGEVAELVALIRQISLAWEPDACLLGNMTAGQLTRAADLLEQRHPTPVPLSERLPGPEDCDAEERCWLLVPRWILPPQELTHWLSATALPLPAGEVQP